MCKFEFSSPRNALCQIWLKLTQWFLIFQRTYTILLSRPYGGGLSPGFEQTEIPFTQVIWLSSGSGEEDANVKSLQWNDDNRQRINFDQKSSVENLTQVS